MNSMHPSPEFKAIKSILNAILITTILILFISGVATRLNIIFPKYGQHTHTIKLIHHGDSHKELKFHHNNHD